MWPARERGTTLVGSRGELPGDAVLGASVAEVAAAAEVAVEPSDVFGVTFLGGDGYVLIGAGLEASDPVTIAAVPFLPTCD